MNIKGYYCDIKPVTIVGFCTSKYGDVRAICIFIDGEIKDVSFDKIKVSDINYKPLHGEKYIR